MLFNLFIKWPFYILVGAVVIGFFFGDDTETVAKVETETPKVETKVETEVVEKAPSYSEFDQKWLAADDRKKLGLTIDDQKYTGVSLCKTMARQASKFPSKVDFNWGYDDQRTYWTNGNDVNRGQYTVRVSGEAMNGFGMMLPFSVECDYAVNIRGKSLHPTTVTWNSGGSQDVLLDVSAPDINEYKGKTYEPKLVDL